MHSVFRAERGPLLPAMKIRESPVTTAAGTKLACILEYAFCLSSVHTRGTSKFSLHSSLYPAYILQIQWFLGIQAGPTVITEMV